MKKDKKAVTFFKQKSYLLAAVLMLAAVLGMTGVYMAQQNEEKKQQENTAKQQQAKLAQQEKTEQEKTEQRKQEEEETSKTTAVDRVIKPENDDFMDEPDVISSSNQAASENEEADSETKDSENEETEGTKSAQTEETEEEETAETSAAPSQPELHFNAASDMGWPLSGNVILNFSKDQTIYFATLDQYKTNEALVIQGNVNDPVSSVADGVVTNIEYDRPETGCTVTVDLGDGYSAVYGQLKEVPLNAGDYVEAGAVIGYVSEPTKYYSVEGPNLYFQIIKDNEAIDPMGFLQ